MKIKVLFIFLASFLSSQAQQNIDSILVINDRYSTIQKIKGSKGIFKGREYIYQNQGIYGRIKGVYTNGFDLFIMIDFENKTNIDFHLQNITFSERDQEKSSLIDKEEIFFESIYYTPFNEIRRKQKLRVVFVMKKFSIPSDKNFVIQLYEKNASRNLYIEIDGKKIQRAWFVK